MKFWNPSAVPLRNLPYYAAEPNPLAREEREDAVDNNPVSLSVGLYREAANPDNPPVIAPNNAPELPLSAPTLLVPSFFFDEFPSQYDFRTAS